MIRQLLDSKRLSRARGIADRNVTDFTIVSKDPLQVFCTITGSSTYKVVIDLKAQTIAHSCPDAQRRRVFCKHIGKLLLMLDDSAISQVYRNKNYRFDTSKHLVDEMMQELKKQHNSGEKFDTGENQEIKIRISELDDLSFLLNLQQMEEIPLPLIGEFKKRMRTVFDGILTKNLKTLLDLLYLGSEISSVVGYDIVRELEKYRGVKLDVFEIQMLGVVSRMLSDLVGRDIDLPNISTSEIDKLLDREFRHYTPRTDWVRRWVARKKTSFLPRISVDDIMIYYVKSNGENPKLGIGGRKTHRNNGIYNLPLKELEQFPATFFMIKRIVGGLRDYITREEIDYHRRFIEFANGEDVPERWREKARTHSVASDWSGKIIHWDINTNRNIPYRLIHASNYSLTVPDPKSPIVTALQPFDYTLCHKGNVYLDKNKDIGIRGVVPKGILSPQDVINAIYRGVEIESNILPWDILVKYVTKGTVNQGDVEVAIKFCEQHLFIYGSYELSLELKNLRKIGREGISDEMVNSFLEKMKFETGRLNSRSRPIAKRFLAADKHLQKLIFIGEEELVKVIVSSLARSSSIEVFRDRMVSRIYDIIRDRKLFHKVISDGEDYGEYNRVKELVRKSVIREIKTLRRELQDGKLSRSSRRTFIVRMVGKNNPSFDLDDLKSIMSALEETIKSGND